MEKDFLTDAEMAALEAQSGASMPDFLSDEDMARLEGANGFSGGAVGNVVGYFGEGANRTLAGVADAVNWPINQGIRGVNAVSGAEIPELSARRYMESVGLVLPDEAPKDAVSRVARTVGGYGMSALLSAAGLGGMARAGAGAPVAAAPTGIRGALDAARVGIMAPYRASLPAAATMDLGLSIPSGIGGGVAREVFPDNPLAELVGATAGGLAGAGVAAGGRAALDRWGHGAAARRASEAEARDLGVAARTWRQAQTNPEATGARLDTMGPGPRTVAERTGDAGLRTLQRDVAANDPTFLGNLSQRRQAALGEIDDATAALAPEGSPLVARKALQGRLDDATAQIDTLVTQAQQQAQEAVTALGPRASQADVAAAQTAALETGRKAWKAGAKRLYDAVPRTLRTPMMRVRDALSTLRERDPDFWTENIPPRIASTIDSYGNTEPFHRLEALRRQVGGAIDDAAGNDAKRQALGQLREAIDATLDDVTGTATGEAADALRAANAYYRAGAQVFRDGDVGALLSGKRNAPDPTTSLRRFFTAGTEGRGGMQEWRRSLDYMAQQGQDVAPLRQGMERHVITEAADATGLLDEGVRPEIRARRLSAWLRNHEDALAEVPDIRDRLATVQRAQREAAATVESATRSRREIERGAISAYVTPEALRDQVDSVLSSDDPVATYRTLTNALSGDRDAIRGLERAFWDRAQEAGQTTRLRSAEGDAGQVEAVFSPSKALSFLQSGQNRRAMRAILGEERAGRLERLLSEAVTLEENPLPGTSRPRLREEITRRGESGRATVLSRISKAGKLGFDVVRGKAGGLMDATRAVFAEQQMADYSHRFPTERVLELVEDALVNPDTARLLQAHPTEAALKKVSQILPGLARQSARSAAQATGQQE